MSVHAGKHTAWLIIPDRSRVHTGHLVTKVDGESLMLTSRGCNQTGNWLYTFPYLLIWSVTYDESNELLYIVSN